MRNVIAHGLVTDRKHATVPNIYNINITNIKLCQSLVIIFAFVEFSCSRPPGECPVSQDGRVLSKEEVLRLLPRDMDGLDLKQADGYRRLLNCGERAYPALAQLLNEETDKYVLCSILGVFGESQGNKDLPRRAIRQLIVKTKDKDVVINCLWVLRKIGTKEDVASVLPFLDREENSVRIYAAEALGAVGDQSVLPEIQRVYGKRLQRCSGDREKDISLPAIHKAIEDIKKRSKK